MSIPIRFAATMMLLTALAPIVQAASPFGHPSERAGKNQGYVGISFHDVTDDRVGLLRLKEARGEEIIVVDHDGPGAKAGLHERDVIMQMNGVAIENEEQLHRLLRDTKAGKRVTFLISRDGQQQTIEVQLANRQTVGQEAWERHMTVPEPKESTGRSIGFFSISEASAAGAARQNATASSSYTGALLDPLGPQLADYFGAQTGLLVREVELDSPASLAGLRAGDVVVRVNTQPVGGCPDWLRTMYAHRGKAVSVVVLRDKREQTLTLIPDARKRSSIEPGAELNDPFSGRAEQGSSSVLVLMPVRPVE